MPAAEALADIHHPVRGMDAYRRTSTAMWSHDCFGVAERPFGHQKPMLIVPDTARGAPICA